ncbi:TBC1 domain family member 6 [Paragonimus westermani]|uniref:TBC1 domain family member 6 n=1 Tax=Paragonimus westermani TaxID=34504 RepID=A0A5J4NW70_9TREM|nr:TBC1 domain family member 6 [Paragonimus westermani]
MTGESGSESYQLKGFAGKGSHPINARRYYVCPYSFVIQIWMEISGAMQRLQTYPGLYRSLLSQQPPQKLLNVILVDVPRTYPENVHFRNPDDSNSKLHSLERVLKAFAVRFPHIGYCQGLNYITAILLLILRGRPEEVEEQAFWLLDALVNDILPSYYSDDMVSVRRDCMVLGELLRIKDNTLYGVIVNSGVNFTVLCAKWFICLYADVLPIEFLLFSFTRCHSELFRLPFDSHFVQTTLRIFDCLFYEGDKILFRAGLALIRLHRNQLLECDEFPVLITAFRNMCRDKQTLWCHEFLQALFSLSGSLSRSKISELRVQCESRVHEDR